MEIIFHAVTELPPPHKTVLAKCKNRGWFEARVCYGMHEPFWTVHRTGEYDGLNIIQWIDLPELFQ